ncbi:aldo/keto reductase [Pedobacter sp. NJ-S-72]
MVLEKMNNGFSLTDNLVLGTAGLGGVWGKVDAYESISTIVHAIEQGILAIDTAPAYGDAEFFLGEALHTLDRRTTADKH